MTARRNRVRSPRASSWRSSRAAARGQQFDFFTFDESADTSELPDEVRAMLEDVRRFGFQGGPGVLAEAWDQVTNYGNERKAQEAERRGVEVIRAEAYL